MTEKEKKERSTLVVRELPKAELRVGTDNSDNEYNLLTIEEALTKLLSDVEEVKKGVLG